MHVCAHMHKTHSHVCAHVHTPRSAVVWGTLVGSGHNLPVALRGSWVISCKWADSILFSTQFRHWGAEGMLWVTAGPQAEKVATPLPHGAPEAWVDFRDAAGCRPGLVPGPVPAGSAPPP